MQILVDNWTNGLWIAGPVGKNPAQTLTRITNMQVQDEGTVATRPGCDPFVALADTTDGAYMSNEHFFKTSTTAVYHNATSLGFTQTGRRLRIAGLATFGVPNDLTFFPISMKKYYTGNVSNWGITDAPTAPVATDSGVAGNLTGDYIYRLVFHSSTTLTTGALGALSTLTSVTGKQMTLTGIPTASTDPQVDEVYIYRTQGGITDAYYYVDKVTLGTATYTDNVSDLGLGNQIINQYISPPTCGIAGRYKSRLLLLDITGSPRYMYPSLGSTPEGYSSLMYEMVADSGDTIEAVIELGDYAYIFGRNSIYMVQVDASDIIYYAKLPSGRGTLNGRTVSMGVSGIYFLSDDGVYVLTGFTSTKVSANVDALFRGVDRGGLSTIADAEMVAGSFVGGRYYLTYYGVDGVWHTVVFNEERKRWKHYTGWRYTTPPVTGSMPVVGLPDSVGLYSWIPTTDDGVGYTSLCGFNLPGIPPTVLVDFRRYRLSVESTGNVQVDIYDNGVLKWSAEPLAAPVFGDAYKKYSVDLGEYFVQPEIVLSSTSPFTLKAFEAVVDPVRTTAFDYTRVVDAANQQTTAQ